MNNGVHWLFFKRFSAGGEANSSPFNVCTNKSSGKILSFCTPEGAIYISSLKSALKHEVKKIGLKIRYGDGYEL